jgi:2-(1,2-epoxy-1,2-dihydrophenyl)acetyl-CoA isomerase
MMAYETILYDVADNIATITLNRPETYNALTPPMYRELIDAFRQVQRDNTVRAVLFTGAGKGFCSGADLTSFDISSGKIEVGDVLRGGLNQIVMAMRGLEKPIVCALNGVAAGAGASLSLACDFRIASERATYVFAAFLSIGIIPDAGLTYLLPQLVGVGRALELAMMADAQNRVTMDQAYSIGLVNRVVPADELAAESRAYAGKLAQMATRAVGMTKRAMYRAAERSLAEALEYEAQVQDGAFKTEDFREGVSAFLEKRPATFKGK